MNLAKNKEPTRGAGSVQKALYTDKSILQNQHIVNQSIAKTRSNLHLDHEEWQRFSIFCARLALDSAPDDVRILFTGKPSATSKDALLLAEIYTVLMIHAEDAATAANTTYAYADIWTRAIEIWGGDL